MLDELLKKYPTRNDQWFFTGLKFVRYRPIKKSKDETVTILDPWNRKFPLPCETYTFGTEYYTTIEGTSLRCMIINNN